MDFVVCSQCDYITLYAFRFGIDWLQDGYWMVHASMEFGIYQQYILQHKPNVQFTILPIKITTLPFNLTFHTIFEQAPALTAIPIKLTTTFSYAKLFPNIWLSSKKPLFSCLLEWLTSKSKNNFDQCDYDLRKGKLCRLSGRTCGEFNELHQIAYTTYIVNSTSTSRSLR